MRIRHSAVLLTLVLSAGPVPASEPLPDGDIQTTAALSRQSMAAQGMAPLPAAPVGIPGDPLTIRPVTTGRDWSARIATQAALSRELVDTRFAQEVRAIVSDLTLARSGSVFMPAWTDSLDDAWNGAPATVSSSPAFDFVGGFFADR